MPAAQKDITIEQGATFQMLLTFLDSSNSAIDISTWTFAGKVKSAAGGSTAAAFSFEFVTDGTDGALTVSISATISGNVAAGKYLYDLKATKVDSTAYRIIEGAATVVAGIT